MSFPAAIDPRRARWPRPSMPSVRFGFRRPSRIGLIVSLLALVAVLAGSWLLVRNSSLVAVEQVKVVGLSGYYDKDARRAIVEEATSMTTMNFDTSRTEETAGEFVDVAAVKVDTDFPHAATIHIEVRRPVLIARVGGRTVTLSQTGEVIQPTHAIPGLVKIDVPGTINGRYVTSGRAHQAVQVLGAAPDILLRKVKSVRWGKLGIVLSMENGPDLYFGDPSNAKRKWIDAAAVLASSKSTGAAYLDLRVPGRVSVGGIGGAPLPQTSSATTDATETPAAETATSTATDTTTTQTTETQQPVQQTPQQTTPTTQQQTPAAAGGAAPAG